MDSLSASWIIAGTVNYKLYTPYLGVSKQNGCPQSGEWPWTVLRFAEIGKKLSVPVASKRRAASFTVYSNVADSISSSRSPEVGITIRGNTYSYNLSRPELKPSPKRVSDIHPSSRADVVPGYFPGKLYLLEQFSHSLVPEHSELTMLYCGRTLAPALPN
ncbi:hypothetical protein DTO271G3_249 [Paecilomyces variotii]|nr:hypothetical protein DTO271G3_249 [Paecilomyces variotii]